jgi:ceroid-lipofuscinosis MFS transporter 7
VYETLGAQIGVDDYHLAPLMVGLLISLFGLVGFIQLLFFDSLWSNWFCLTDFQLIKLGLLVMICAQLIIYSYGFKYPSFTQYLLCVGLMYSFGYPVGHTAVLGAFSKIQKSGPQAALMGWFATAGSFSRIIMPIIAGYTDKLVDNSPFSIVLLSLSLSLVAVIFFRHRIEYFIQDNNGVNDVLLPISNNSASNDRNGEVMSSFELIQLRVAGLLVVVALLQLALAAFGINSIDGGGENQSLIDH